jgi:hypothetical protein
VVTVSQETIVEVGVVQVHPDAASMEFHIGIVAEREARAYAEALEATTSIQVTESPSEAVLEMLRRQFCRIHQRQIHDFQRWLGGADERGWPVARSFDSERSMWSTRQRPA